jgi:hypothetical protein
LRFDRRENGHTLSYPRKGGGDRKECPRFGVEAGTHGGRDLEGGFSCFAVADADGFIDRYDEDFSIANFSGAGGGG